MDVRKIEQDRCPVSVFLLCYGLIALQFCYGSDCPIKMSFQILIKMLFSERKKDLGNEQKACIFMPFFHKLCFMTLSGKRKEEFFFLTFLRNQRCFYTGYFGWPPDFFLNKPFHTNTNIQQTNEDNVKWYLRKNEIDLPMENYICVFPFLMLFPFMGAVLTKLKCHVGG